ncbi:MAG: hypothetical protein SAJ12_07475 [Jaaginema sp. PMC 1079.18]|nr:hypothetical protein [Jaaginema sp. PMC 1080.18]MEC4850838.1 hypothetical protein [Jaaginema sp. PMC 1079.18]MEC4868351.1 hypothetical protein [Jaaginema sp. PMC 1078.18]
MAIDLQVKDYLAHWFQLGKKLIHSQSGETILPTLIYQNGKYSDEFERCWQNILQKGTGNFYLEGMPQSLQELLSSEWELVPCARCELPIPIRQIGNQSSICPCNDLASWPNDELPQPRQAVNSKNHLTKLGDRLHQQQIAQDTCDRLWQDHASSERNHYTGKKPES